MRATLYTLSAVLLFSCAKDEKAAEVAQSLSTADAAATQAMRSELSAARTAVAGLSGATTVAQQHHFDSLYHQHDSLFWVHHNEYHHGTYTHDDHGHHWTAYDPNVHHDHHYHHPYPGHQNDSLVVTPSGHGDNNNDGHHPAHGLSDHHTLDSLHQVHNAHHP